MQAQAIEEGQRHQQQHSLSRVSSCSDRHRHGSSSGSGPCCGSNTGNGLGLQYESNGSGAAVEHKAAPQQAGKSSQHWQQLR
jgi:hypothetical protein